MQEGRISGRQVHFGTSDASDIVFDSQPHLAATETTISAMSKEGRSLALA
ncbi:hypothetical protein FHS25_000032 [Rhizobium laguerreae]|uniref:Uncharacterized protein n=1 Tax=Rhizobium laguerreae TaxID=1076926 RepID=A0ABR6G007_9HYPH|nr:hypothetical protein [Rhizobium laguerreae]MBB3159600.1 hypothetical protein [Rhizobium laguerreae]